MGFSSIRHRSQSMNAPVASMLLASFLCLAHGALAQDPSAQAADPAPVDYRGLAADFARKTAKLQEIIEEIPRHSMDPRAVVAEVGTDPLALAAWVARETRWVPYRGILRGPVGVLMDRRGNSADRALLLLELLRAAGLEPTLQRGHLSEESAAGLFAALAIVDQGGTDLGSMSTMDAESVGAVAGRMGITVSELQTELLGAQSTAQRAAEHGIGQVMAQSNELGAFLDAGRVKSARALELAESQETLRDHFWVTLKRGDETLRLDPLLDTLPGPLHADAEAVEPPASIASFSYDQRNDLPAELYHTLTVTFEVERTDGPKIERLAALSHSVRPYALGAESLMLACSPLGYVPPAEADLAGLTPAQRAAKQRAALLKVDEWLPQIVVSGSLKEDKSFRSDGSLNASPQKGTGRLVEGAASVLGSLGTGGAKKSGEATALFVSFVSRRPGPGGVEEERHERVIFDVLGESRRAIGGGLETLDETSRLTRSLVGGYTADVAALVCVPSEAYLHGLTLTTIQSNRESIIEMTLAQGEEDEAKALRMATGAAQSLRPRPVLQWTWGHLRRLYGGSDARVFVDRINLVSFVRVAALPNRAADGLMARHEGVDVVMNHVGISSAPGEAPGDAARLRLRQGVADTVLEATIATAQLGSDVGSTSGSFARKSSPWTRATEAAPDAPRTVADDFSGGLAIAPQTNESAQRTAGFYWRIDAATGETLGMGPNGWGQSSAETLVQLQLAAIFIEMFRCSGQPVAARPQCLAGAICAYVGLAVGALTLNPIAGFSAGTLCVYATR